MIFASFIRPATIKYIRRQFVIPLTRPYFNVFICLHQWKHKFGHRFHKPVDPRAPRLMALVREAVGSGEVSGRYADIGEAVQAALGRARGGRAIAMNIDGATAVIFCELGFPAPLSRGLFCLSRSVGILAHAWEQMQQGGRNKGPNPPKFLPKYEGKSRRS